MTNGFLGKHKMCEFCKTAIATTKLTLDENEVYNSCEECKMNIFETIRDSADNNNGITQEWS